ncbi:MAG TPA: glycosyltransferase family 39 protein [Candidatus Dormibacteraeota bacterium]|nr:glycosyltransferase family 39 protein [Candidatus Dormibacteraeota bacterium]
MASLQEWIYKMEQGSGARYVKIIAVGVSILALAFFYNFRAYRNFDTQEAMDAAQLAHNLADGKGYTTLFVRPLSIYLLQSHAEAGSTNVLAATNPDLARLKTTHPDLANPPVYPLVLAGLMKVLPFHFTINTKSSFWGNNGNFWRYQPDFLIAVFNEILLLVVVALTFLLALKLFDTSVARLSATLMLGCEMLWKFSASGLSTMLLLVIFLGLVWCILKIEEIAREPQPLPNRLCGLALTAGILVGIGALTRYAFGWVIIPVAVFLILFSGQRRTINTLAAFGAFLVVFAPWVVRNFIVSGTPFGTASFALLEGTQTFPNFQLERSLHPDFSNAFFLGLYVHKLLVNARDILTSDLPKLGGSWASALFLAGLLMTFRSAAIRRMRYFLLMCLAVFVVAQALGRTQLSEESPEINSENLLVLLAPLIFVYGVSFFFTFLEQMKLPLSLLRYIVIFIFGILCCLPWISGRLLSKTIPIAYPPYYPPDIRQTAAWMKPEELMMSDVPWAVAWYGQRQCVWLTANAQDDFFAINDYMKPVQALYLTPETMDGKFVSDWVRAGKNSWGNFIIQAAVQNQIPPGFPLHHAPTGFLPDRLFLTDWDRWKTGQTPDVTP